ncbi:hypothetical protein GCM10025768_05730 [Microbacterium pseudoresistens]|uniref:Uncharacterized protein n=1 Tax=Microbacterium pseudoresistens TaxID=640634 RepID=A0A7Y9EV63_9MICO|nr:YdeI/OmpD-associated family protein [Microbacterium pseudoresistens]NYD54409.1 hypothetical protein [Microbacterium pseudoresistens]
MPELHLHTELRAMGPAGAFVLTDAQVAELTDAKTAPVVVTVGDRSIRLRLSRMRGENLIGFSKAARAELGVELGETLDAVVALDTAERTVEVPAPLATALDESGLREGFDALAYSRRKEMARTVADAKQEATRARRIAKVIDELGG